MCRWIAFRAIGGQLPAHSKAAEKRERMWGDGLVTLKGVDVEGKAVVNTRLGDRPGLLRRNALVSAFPPVFDYGSRDTGRLIIPDPWPFSDAAMMRQPKSATNPAVSPEQPCLQQLIPPNAAKQLLHPVIRTSIVCGAFLIHSEAQ